MFLYSFLLLTSLQQFGEDPHVGVMVRCPDESDHIYVHLPVPLCTGEVVGPDVSSYEREIRGAEREKERGTGKEAPTGETGEEMRRSLCTV